MAIVTGTAVATSPYWLPYLLALGAGGTYAMNRDKINRMAGGFSFPWPGRESAEERWLRTGSFEEPTVITARPDATNSEMDARQIISSGGGPGGNGGNNGDNWDQDPKFLRGARYGDLPARYIADQANLGIDKIFNREQDDVLTDQVLQSEGQDSSDKVSDFLAKAQWLEDTRNSPAARSGAFTDDQRWGTYLGNQAWRKDQGRSYNTDLDHLLKPSSENKRVWNVFGNEMVFDK
jgi:hypothetical protein